jgi:hypothetical protein
VLELILRHGREIIEARALVVFLLEGDELVLAAGCEDDADDGAVRLAVSGSLAA